MEKNVAIIEERLADRRIVQEAHNRARGIIGIQEAGDLAQSALLEMWDKATKDVEDQPKLTVRDLAHFWQVFTTTAQRIKKSNRQKERRHNTANARRVMPSHYVRKGNCQRPTYGEGQQILQHNPPGSALEYCETCEMWDRLTEEQKQLAVMKAAGMNNKQIARTKKTRLANVTHSLRMIKAQISA